MAQQKRGRNRRRFDQLTKAGVYPRMLTLKFASNKTLMIRPYTREEYEEDIWFCIEAFNLTRNGAFLWRAYRHMRAAKVPLNETVLDYLDLCAEVVKNGERDSDVTAGMMLRHRKGGAGPGRRMQAALRQVAILDSLVSEYRKVHTGEIASKLEARRNVARIHGTTEGRVRQLMDKFGM